MSEKIQTGIEGIDRKLSGGIESGSLLSVVAGPATQSEQLFHQMSNQRPTVYLTTLRESSAVKQRINGSSDDLVVKDTLGGQSIDNTFMKELTGHRHHSMNTAGGDEILDTVYETIENVDRQRNVIIDPINPLEEKLKRDAYRELINKLKKKTLETGGLGILHCITLKSTPPLRDMTLAMSDTVIELKLVSLKNEKQYQLTIPKNRGGTILLEEKKVKFDVEPRLDNTRNI